MSDAAENSLHYRRVGVGGFVFVGVDFAVVFGVEGAMLSVLMLRRHAKDKAIFLAFEADGIVAAVRIDHAFGERAGVNQFGERSSVVVILLLEAVLGADHDAHVGERGSFGIGAGRVAGELRLIGARGLSGYKRTSGSILVLRRRVRITIKMRVPLFVILKCSPPAVRA